MKISDMKIASKKSLFPLASAAALSIGTVGTAQAGVLASSILEITDLVFQVQEGGSFRPVNITDISISEGFNTSDVSVQLDSANGGVPIADTTQVSFQDDVDIGECIGVGCPAPNNFSPPVAPPVSGVFSNADTLLEGSSVVISPEQPVGADAQVRTDVALASGINSGSSAANLGLVSSFEFTALEDIQVRFEFNYSYNLRALITPDLADTGNSAQAAAFWDLTVEGFDDAVRFNFRPVALQQLNTGSTIPGTNRVLSDSGTINSESEAGLVSLVQGNQYSLTIRHNTNADASIISEIIPVPEPTSIALLGGGLLSLAAWRRRTKKI